MHLNRRFESKKVKNFVVFWVLCLLIKKLLLMKGCIGTKWYIVKNSWKSFTLRFAYDRSVSVKYIYFSKSFGNDADRKLDDIFHDQYMNEFQLLIFG